MAQNSEPCPLCESFAAPHMKGVVRHIGLVHSHEFAFRVTCGVGGCTRTYTRFSSYKKHMYVKHRDVLGVSTREQSPDLTDSNLISHSYEEEWPEPYIATLLICRPYMADMTLHVIPIVTTFQCHSSPKSLSGY